MTLALVGVVLLALAGTALLAINLRKLIKDWPRPKPVHNVDAAWVQIYLGVALLAAAWFWASDPARPLFEPAPMPVRTDQTE